MTAVQVAVSPFAEAAPDLTGMGYSTIPLVPADLMRDAGRGKRPGAFVGGHWRGADKWERHRDSPLEGFALGMAMKSPGANIGLVLGTVARPGLYVIAVDVDVTCPDALDTIVRCLPASPMAKRGAKGLTLFYAAPKTITSRSYDDHRVERGSGISRRLVDVLTGFETRQTVCPPSVHPESMQRYVWTAGPVRAADLPLFDEDALEKLTETLQQFGYDPAAARGGRGERKPYVPTGDTSGDPFEIAKRAALANLSAWVPEVANIARLRPARGGYEGVSLMRDSSTGKPTHERKRNLSIQANGIRDFGTDETFSAVDLVAYHNGLTVSEALGWLEERLGLPEVDDGIVIDLASFTASTRAATSPPVTDADGSGGDVSSMVAARAVDTMPTVERKETHGEMPAHLLQIPGLVGEIIDYVVATARKPQRSLALATALTVVGTCGGRRYAGPTGSGTHLYALVLAKSGAGKDHNLDVATRLLSAADLHHHIGKGEWMSFQAVYKSLNRQPLTLNPIDELGGFLRRINKRNSGGNEQAITAVLRTAWGKSFKMLPPPEWAGQDMDPIWSPALSILGASTHDDFFKAIEAGDTDNGFLNRWLMFSTQSRPPVQKPTADLFEAPASIIDQMKAIYLDGNPLANATMHANRCDRPAITVQWADGEDGDLNRAYLEWAEELDEASDSESFFARAAEQAVRLMTIRAMGCNPTRPVIDRDCYLWGRELSMWCANRMLLDAREFMAENQTQSDRQKVVRAIRQNSPLTHRDLLRKLTTFKGRELDDIVKGLELAELIRVDTGPPAANHKRPKIYTWLGDR